MNRQLPVIIIIMMCWNIFAQPNNDARMLGLNGAYTTLARGYQCVGINPANLGINNIKSANILNMSMGFSTNSLSVSNYNAINGANLEDSTAVNWYPGGKEAFYNSFGGEGIRIIQSLKFPLSGINISVNKYALTSNLLTNIDMGIPNGLLDFYINGILPRKEINIDMEQLILVTEETGLSYGHSFQNFSAGFTMKYILGLFYMGIESIGKPYIRTEKEGLMGENQYLIKQAIGGSGVGLDLGISTHEIKDGYRFGISIINLLGNVKWTQDHFIRSQIDNTIQNSASDFYLRPNEFMYINMVMNSFTALSFSKASEEPLIYYDIYKVMPVDYIDSIAFADGDSNYIVYYGDKYLLPSGGKYERNDLMGDEDIEISNFSDYSNYSTSELNPFTTRQPMYFRIGFSKRWDSQAVVATDLVTGFSDRFDSSTSWRLSIATEITRFKNKFLRLGYAFGGLTKKSISMGYGHKMGNLYLDVGMSLNGGFSLETAKGIDIAFGLIWEKVTEVN